jgi:hypothetical protein
VVDHHGHDPLAQQKGAGQLDREQLVPDGLLQVGHGHPIVAAGVSGIVDQDIEAPETLQRVLHQALDRCHLEDSALAEIMPHWAKIG